MIRNLKALSLALVAVFAMSALVASTASATSEFWFRTDASTPSTKTKLNGKQTVENGDVFKVDGGEVKCKTGTYSGEEAGTTFTTLDVKPTYGGCTFTGALTATVNMKTCFYRFHTDGHTTGANSNIYHVTATIVCGTTGDSITVTVENAQGVEKCVIHVPEQDVGTITLTNNGSKTHITAEISLSAITYSQTEGTGIGKCPTADNTNNGTYSGEASLEGVNEGGTTTAIWVE